MLDTYTPTTELEAVNAILAAANEAPVDSLDAAAGRGDVALALSTLAEVQRETLSYHWRFNSDINYRLTGVAEGDGYVFPEPPGMLAFTLTRSSAQYGWDIVSRPSRTYQVGGASVRILTDRVGGFDTLSVSELFINPVWAVPFSLMPEHARRYIVRSAVRRRVQQGGYPNLQACAADEAGAWRELQRHEGNAEKGNLFRDNPAMARMRGRTRNVGSFLPQRNA